VFGSSVKLLPQMEGEGLRSGHANHGLISGLCAPTPAPIPIARLHPPAGV